MDALIKHSALLQLTMAAVNSLKHPNNTHLHQLQGTEKVLKLNLDENDSPSCLSHILTLLKNVQDRTRSYYLEDILLLILYVYSLVGEESLNSPEEEDELKEVVVNEFLLKTLKPKTKIIVDMEKDSEKVVRYKIEECFERLYGLRKIRKDLTIFKDVFISASTDKLRSYEPILEQIVRKVFDPKKPEINDIEYKSTRLKDYIKSGFSLFMNVRKPHPSDHPLLFLFVVGGVTSAEVKKIKEVLTSQNIKTKVIIGSTKILNSQDTLRSFFCQDNTFPDLGSN